MVEDEDSIRQLVEILLESAGHDAEGAASGPEALECLSERPFDLVVLDLMLGRISGWQVLRQMERWNLRARTKVLILTARASERDILHGWRMGVDEYVTKPFEPDVFLEAVRDTLRRSPEELAVRREEELHKSELLYRLQLAFDDVG